MRRRSLTLLFLALALVAPAAAHAQRAVIVVRHAEKVSDQDERLSEAGRARAVRLAALLKDAGLTAIYTTDTERTRDTAKPTAEALAIPVRIYDVGSAKVDAAPFVQLLRREHDGGAVLVVGHSNTVPAILSALGCTEPVTIGKDEYDDLFIVVPKGEGATLVRLRY